MSNKTRKRIWPAALMSLAVFGVLAAVVALSTMTPQPSQAHGCDQTNLVERAECVRDHVAGGIDDPSAPHEHETPTPPPTIEPEPAMASIKSTSTSASATVQLTLTIPDLTEAQADMLGRGGSSVVLYLEDDFGVPDDIDRGDVYFTASGSDNDMYEESTSNGRRVYATDPIAVETDSHFTADKDDYDIQVLIPDMNTTDDYDGFDGPKMGQTLVLVFTKSAGIKNNSEEGKHSVGYSILGPTDSVGDPMYADDKIDGAPLQTLAKIGLSDVDNDRGYELVVTGSGFNNGTSAAVHVLGDATPHPEWWNSTDCMEMNAIARSMDTEGMGYCRPWAMLTQMQRDHLMMFDLMGGGPDAPDGATADEKAAYAKAKATAEATFCRHIIQDGQRAGIATVGSDDKVAVTVEVTVPTFVPGNNNYICMVDGEGRSSSTDVEDFKLLDSLRVVPSSAAAGDTVNVFAQDFPNSGESLSELKIAGQVVWPKSAAGDNYISVSHDPIGPDGSATATFDLPGSISGSALEGTVRIDVTWGEDPDDVSEDGKITITGSLLTLSKSEALANELITITGDGFGGDYIDVMDITIDGVPLMVDSDSMHRMGTMDVVDVSNAGQFVASVVLWPADDGSNPSLIAGTHTIEVEDDKGFSGSAVVSIPDASISVTPAVAGPRDVITITGVNWPIDNIDGAAPDPVEIEISDGTRARRYSAFADSAGRFTVEHRVASNVAIPSTNQVRANMGDGDIVKVGSFEVPAAIITIEPAEGQPGDHITLSVDGMPVYQQVDRVEIGGRSVLPVGNFSTDANGDVTVTDVLIPGLDPGTYSVLLDVEDTIAIGELNVLAESAAVGAAAALPDAVEALGDSLAAIFYFDDVGKEWSFYDPRPEFADLNTLSEMVSGEAYWILVSETVEDVVLNNKVRSLTCRGDDCWNLEVW